MKKKVRAKAKAKAPKKSKPRKAVKAKTKTKAKASSSKKRPAKKKAAAPPKPGVIAPANSVLLGFVDDYFAKIGVIALKLKAPVNLGQKIQVLGHTTNLQQTLDSMQIDHASVTQAGSKDEVGIKVIGRARRGDHVYSLK
jgi:N-acetylmuramoyl-L-alanine amidase